MKRLDINSLIPGLVVGDHVRTPSGQILAPTGTVLTQQLINRMKLYRITQVTIKESTDAPFVSDDSIDGEKINIPVSNNVVSQVKITQENVAQTKNIQTTTNESATPSQKAAPTHAEKSITHSQKVAASDDFKDFQMQYFSAIEKLKLVFSAATDKNQQIDTTDLLNSVSSLFTSRNTIIELFDMLYNMRIVKDSVYAHSLNTGLISRMIGRWLKMDKHDLDVLTLSGLLHDIGKTQIPDSILNKPGKLTDQEFALIKQHPKLGYDILKNQNLDPHIKKSALMHHERCDGSGYPSGLEEDFIDEYAMIVGIADVYDAMTTARSYRAPLCPFQVISNFEEEGFQKYNTKYILTFLQQIAATYQSNRVILNDGRGCNIVMLNQTALSKPMVQLDDSSIIDLSSQRDLYIKAVL